MKKFVVILVLILGFACKPTPPAPEGSVVQPAQLEQKLNSDIQLVDVRTAEEYANGHIGDAVNMDVLQAEKFPQEIQSLDKTKPVYVYCKSGVRSNKAANILREAGFAEVKDLDGGYTAWEAYKK